MRNNKKWCVYKHVSPSGKVYIGITSDIKRRWECHGRAYKACKKFYNAIKKYGWDNLTHEILYDNLERTQANVLEIGLIRFYKNKNISYNLSNGGDGTSGIKMSEANRKRISELHKGNKYSLGRIQSKEEREKRRISNLGKKRSIETIKKLSDSSKKKVYRYSLDGKYIDEYDSALDAQNILGINRAKIGACCLFKRKSAGGYIWRFSLENVDAYSKDRSIMIIQHNTITGEDIIYDSLIEASKKSKVSLYYIHKNLDKNTIHENCTWRKCNKNDKDDQGDYNTL